MSWNPFRAAANTPSLSVITARLKPLQKRFEGFQKNINSLGYSSTVHPKILYSDKIPVVKKEEQFANSLLNGVINKLHSFLFLDPFDPKPKTLEQIYDLFNEALYNLFSIVSELHENKRLQKGIRDFHESTTAFDDSLPTEELKQQQHKQEVNIKNQGKYVAEYLLARYQVLINFCGNFMYRCATKLYGDDFFDDIKDKKSKKSSLKFKGLMGLMKGKPKQPAPAVDKNNILLDHKSFLYEFKDKTKAA